MARMIPTRIHQGCKSNGERDVFRRLKEEPNTRDWIVLHSLDIAQHRKQISGELDFIVIMPNKGVLCLEVKGCGRIERTKGNWFYGSDPTPDPRGPFKQVAEAMHSLRLYIAECKPSLSKIVFWSAVIYPYLTFDSTSGEWHPWQVIDSNRFNMFPLHVQLEFILGKARELLQRTPSATWFDTNSEEPSLAQCEELVSILRPDFVFLNSQNAIASKIQELKHYTEEQYIALDAMQTNSRVIFNGLAGTGKTLLAIEAARRAKESGKKVLLLCYNRLLVKWLEEQVKSLLPGVTCKTLHSFMLEVAKIKLRENVPLETSFWESELPLIATKKLNDTTIEQYDEIIIDEAQDIFKEKYLNFLDKSFVGGLRSGNWKIFGDFINQRIYRSKSLTLEEFANNYAQIPTYSLCINCRNTPRIVAVADLLGGVRCGSRILRPDDGIEPELCYFSAEDDQELLIIKSLEKLEKEGYSHEHIVILSPKTKGISANINNPSLKDCLRPYETFMGQHIGYCSIHSFKGLESPAVIITDIYNLSEVVKNNLLYTAITRALHRLIIFVHESEKYEVVKTLLNL